jgi:hypothetical protein
MATPLKSVEDYQRALYKMFAEAGEIQYMVRSFKQGLALENDKLNTLNQKLETTQKAFFTFVAQQKAPDAPTEVTPDVKTDENV